MKENEEDFSVELLVPTIYRNGETGELAETSAAFGARSELKYMDITNYSDGEELIEWVFDGSLEKAKYFEKEYPGLFRVVDGSKMMKEENSYGANLATIKELLKHSTVLKSHANAKGGPTIPEIESFIDRNRNNGKFLWWYSEPGEETGLQELSPEVALETAKAIETLSPVPEGVVSGFASSLHYVENPVNLEKLTSVTKYPRVSKG
jgi:hypothetical protein